MRTLALLVLLSPCILAQTPLTAPLTPKDRSEIRTAIEEQAKQENLKPSVEIWSERGPRIYHVRTIEPIAANVATTEADGVRTGAFSERGQYLFILTRTNGRWSITKRIQVCDGPGLKLICGSPRSSGPGSSGCLN
jgi:hypothetical protein